MPSPSPVGTIMDLRVRYHECDTQGVVFNAHYLAFFDMAVVELWRSLLGSYAELLALGVDTMVAETTLRYRAPARYDEKLVVEVAVVRVGTTSFVLAFTVRRGEDLIAEGESRYVFVDAKTLQATTPPVSVRARLAGEEPVA